MSDEDRIARVARALCVADGHDPDEAVYLGRDDVEVAGTSTAATCSCRPGPPMPASPSGSSRRRVAGLT